MRLPFLKGSYSALDCLFLIVWVRFTLLDYVRIVVMHLPVINSLSNFVIPIVMVTFILLSLKSFAERLSLSDVFFYVIVVCLYLMTYAFYPENTKYLDEMSFQFLMCSLPYFFVGRIIDYEKIAKPLYILSVISIICITLLYFLGNAEEREEVSGMHRAYQMLPYVCVVFCRVFKNKDIISIIIAFLSIFVLLSFGNRGSVLYLFVFIILGIIPSMKSKHKFFIILAISFIIVLFYMYFDFIVLGLHGIMEQFGFSVRIFEKIIEGEITDSSGRDVIVNKLFSELNANPWGLGLLGDRVVTGIYAHNFFIEIIVSYGYFVGSMICMLLLICIVKALRTCRHTNNSLFYMSMVCFGFLPLMTSHSFLTYPNFWLFVGYTISILSTKKSQSINSI